jgi:6-pyruvoyl-tetrahydropterin synthase
MVEITQQFTFDAAHRLDAGADENRRLHGHSFYVEVTLKANPRQEPASCAISARSKRR